jgi:hypothetical protein
MDVEHMSIRFYQKLEADSHIKVAYATELISREKCDATIARLLEIYANPSVKKTPNDYYVLRKYDVVNHEGGRALVAKGTQKRFVCHEV